MMLTFQQIKYDGELDRRSPLHVGKFFNLENTWWRKRKERQDAIISIAFTWYKVVRTNPHACGFVQHEVSLTGLSAKLADARKILEHFFIIVRLGFNFGNGQKSPTLITPRRLGPKMFQAVEMISKAIYFDPGQPPSDEKLIASPVRIRTTRDHQIFEQLSRDGKDHLIPAVKWLLSQDGDITFYYERSGKLQARDKSVWPIRSIETWPGWLRTELFGRVVDIENAYCQFLMNCLETKYGSDSHLISLKYPDLARSVYDKSNFRNEICAELLGLELTEENLKLVKKLIMSLANGSNVTPALIASGSGRSEAVKIILEANGALSSADMLKVGRRLSFIAKQFRAAKKDICLNMLNKLPSLKNTKEVFQLYFDWERTQRYKIWEAVGKNGLMLHDGIDGIENTLSDRELEKMIAEKTRIRVSVESPT